VALAAVLALGRVGDASAVLALQAAAARGGDLRPAALQAVAEIQGRTGGAPGQVSLAIGEAGGVSLPDEPGRVTLKD
jgi:hypothetical protein